MLLLLMSSIDRHTLETDLLTAHFLQPYHPVTNSVITSPACTSAAMAFMANESPFHVAHRCTLTVLNPVQAAANTGLKACMRSRTALKHGRTGMTTKACL